MSRIDQKYILLILNCKKYKYKAEKQKQTWLKEISKNILYFHVIGDVDLLEPFLFDVNENILYVKTEDDYNSLPKKVIAAYTAIMDTYMFQYIFKTDDDQNLPRPFFFNTIIHLLENKVPKVHYGGKIIDIQIPHISKYYVFHPELPQNLLIQKTKYCNGRFYLLSWDSVLYLTNKKSTIENEYLEDYAIGFHLPSYLKNNILNIDTDKYFIDVSP